MEEVSRLKEILARTQTIAVIPAEDFYGESFLAGLALFSTLRKLGKKATFMVKEVPARLAAFESLINPGSEAIITVSAAQNKISRLRYEKEGDDLKIYLATDGGRLSPENVTIQPSPFVFAPVFNQKPDLIFIIGAQNLEAVGKIFEENSSIFYEAPIVNIDNHIANELFGSVNMVEPSSPSLAEMVFDIISALQPDAPTDKSTSTQLLTGIMLATHNFQHPRTRPQTLTKASQLMKQGADHQAIVRQFFKRKSLPQLRLLGRALEHLRLNDEKEIAWTTLRASDFQDTQTTSRDLSFLMEELKTNFWKLPSLLLLWEGHGSGPLIKGIFYSKNPLLTEKLLENFEGVIRGGTAIFLVRESEIKPAEEKVLALF